MLLSQTSRYSKFLHRKACCIASTKRQISLEHAASGTSGYSSKVRAVPFALSKDDAIKRLAPWASLFCLGRGLLGSLGARYLPGLGSKAHQPKTIQALYFPVWFIDAKFLGKVRKKSNDTEMFIHVHFVNSHMPGYSYDPLSKLSFSESLMYTLAVPFTRELKRQHNMDIICLPFTVTPLALPSFGQSLSPSQTLIEDDVYLDPASLDFDVLAAYPVLVPFYLAEYEYTVGPSQTKSFLCAVQAHSQKGLVYVEWARSEAALQSDQFPTESFAEDFTQYLEEHVFMPMRFQPPGFSQIETVVTSIPWEQTEGLDSQISHWLDKTLRRHGLESLAKFGVDMDDMRVREFARDEVLSNRTWLSLDLQLIMLKFKLHRKDRIKNMVASQLNSKDDLGDTLGSVPPIVQKSLKVVEKLENSLDKELEMLREHHRTTMPAWIKDWHTLQAKREVLKSKRKTMRMV